MNKKLAERYKDLLVEYKYTVQNNLNTDNEFEDTKTLIVEAMKNRVLDTIVSTEGIGSWQLVQHLYEILNSTEPTELAKYLEAYHRTEKDFIRLARHRKKKKIEKQEVDDYLLESLKKYLAV